MNLQKRNSTSKETLAILAAVVAGILWGIIQIFIRGLDSSGCSLLQIIFLRMLFSAIIFGCVLAFRSPSDFKISIRDIWMFIGTGIVSFVAFNCCYFYTITQNQSSVGVVLMYTSPIFIMVLSALIFKEKITKVKIVALVLTVLGCSLVSGVFNGVSNVSALVIIAGLASGLLYGLYTIFSKFALKKYSSSTVTFYSFLFAALGAAPICRIGDLGASIISCPSILLFALGVSVVCTIVPYAFYTWSLNYIDSGKAAILVTLEPVVGAGLGIIAFSEICNVTKILGIVCVLIAIIALNLKPRKSTLEK